MEFITKKLKNLAIGESWSYGNGFVVTKKSPYSFDITKNGLLTSEELTIEETSKEIKLTYIAIEITEQEV